MKKLTIMLYALTCILILCSYINKNVAPINYISNSNNSTEYNWYVKHTKGLALPEPPPETTSFITKYNDLYLGDTSSKNLYLTFDEGYENGYTSQILDTLAKYKIKAAFFVVKPYITSNPALIKRMTAEGHTVCNHSSTHPSMAKITDRSRFEKEFTDVEKAYTEVTGEKMKKYFRPPMGKYSEQSLKLTKELGYKTIFWSLAYKDWDVKNQPSSEMAMQKILGRTHKGAIILLHTVSSTNAKTLDSLIQHWIKDGYVFKPITDL